MTPSALLAVSGLIGVVLVVHRVVAGRTRASAAEREVTVSGRVALGAHATASIVTAQGAHLLVVHGQGFASITPLSSPHGPRTP